MNNADVYIGVEVDPLEVMSEHDVNRIISEDGNGDFIDTGYMYGAFPVYLLRRVEDRVDELGRHYTSIIRTWWLCAGHMWAREGVAIEAGRMKKFLWIIEPLKAKKSSEIRAFFVRNT